MITKSDFVQWYEKTIDPIIEVDGEARRRTAFRRMWTFINAAVDVSDERRVKAWIKLNAKKSQGKLSPSGFFLALIDNTSPPQPKATATLVCYQPYVAPPVVNYPKGRPLMSDLLERYKRGEDLDAYIKENHPGYASPETARRPG